VVKGCWVRGRNHNPFGRCSLTMVALLVVAVALGLNNFGAAIAIGVGGVDRRTEIKVATVFGLCDVVMPAIGMLIGTRLAGPLGSAARWAGAGILFATAVWGLIEVVRGDDDAPRIWHGWRLLVSGAALSLDDLAVGLALGTVRFPILLAVAMSCSRHRSRTGSAVLSSAL
jgi:manganese efflux pump family protein